MKDFIDLKGYEGFYKISPHGEVWTYNWRRMKKPYLSKNTGYLMFDLYDGHQNRTAKGLHVLLMQNFGPPKPEGKRIVVRHLNGDKLDNRLENLSWGTVKDNYHDSVLHDTNCKGERHGNSKLTDAAVIEIRTSQAKGIELAKKFGVSETIISSLRKGRGWNHVMLPANLRRG